MLCLNGDSFEGYFDSLRNKVKGKMNYTNGNVYVGEFKDGYYHGKGEMIY